jgi:polysaccharide export outer membrane protein
MRRVDHRVDIGSAGFRIRWSRLFAGPRRDSQPSGLGAVRVGLGFLSGGRDPERRDLGVDYRASTRRLSVATLSSGRREEHVTYLYTASSRSPAERSPWRGLCRPWAKIPREPRGRGGVELGGISSQLLTLRAVTRAVSTQRRPITLLLVSLCLLASSRGAEATRQPEYAVGPQDVLTITVWEQPTLSGRFTVGADGNISFPLLGNVKVAGLPSRAIEALLRTRLSDGYLKNPQVTVEVTQFFSQRIFVMGEVTTPGSVALTGEMTLLEALTRVGGLTENAGGELVLLRSGVPNGATASPLVPQGRGVSEVARVSVRDLRAGRGTEIIDLRNGDTIFVPRAEHVFVLGQVVNPGTYTLDPGMTVLRAISLAGGMTRLASTRRIKITRIVGGKKSEINAKLDDEVKGGDTITVGTRWF